MLQAIAQQWFVCKVNNQRTRSTRIGQSQTHVQFAGNCQHPSRARSKHVCASGNSTSQGQMAENTALPPQMAMPDAAAKIALVDPAQGGRKLRTGPISLLFPYSLAPLIWAAQALQLVWLWLRRCAPSSMHTSHAYQGAACGCCTALRQRG